MDLEMETLVDGVHENASHVRDSTLTLTRRVYTHQAFNTKYKTEKPQITLCERWKRNIKCSRKNACRVLLSYFPVIDTVKTYRLKEYILGDILSGLTVSFMHLPQAMGYGILSSLRPINGLYSTFFPVLMYLLLGTSPYISVGTNAVMALLTHNVAEREAETYISTLVSQNLSLPTDDELMQLKEGASMACCAIAGLILMAMGFLKLGIITSYLSVSFVGGFTTAAAFHIMSSQVPKMFGIKVKPFAGAGNLIFTYIDFFSKIAQTKPVEIIIALISFFFLVIVKVLINERYQTKLKMPVPIDLIVVVAGTVISHFANFGERYGVTVIGPIPDGFQTPALPNFSNAGSFATDAFVMAILSLAISISMANLCANKHGILVNDNQELIAYGASNFVSSFFHCFPSTASPPRTMILSSLGARTTLHNIITVVFFLFVILLIGHFFVSLPLSVLAALIIVSMKDLLFQYRTLPSIWRINKYDFCIWVVTNSVGILADLNYGVIAGVGISIFLTVVHDQLSIGHLVGISTDEDLTLTIPDDHNAREIEGIKIFKISSNLYFATSESIKNQIYRNILNPRLYLKKLQKIKNIAKAEDKITAVDVQDGEVVNEASCKINNCSRIPLDNFDYEESIKLVVLDLSVVRYIDMAGIAALQQVVQDFRNVKIDVYLVSVADRVSEALNAANFFNDFSMEHVYVDVFDVISMFGNRK